MEIALIVIFFFVGASIGSFINVLADRLPKDKSIVGPPSHCDSCQRRLTALDLIPVFSYIILRGRCRSCGARIPLRVLWVELGCGILLAFLFWFKGLTADFGIIALYSYIFIVIGLIDLETSYILSKIFFPALGIMLVLEAIPLLTQQRPFTNSLMGAGVGMACILVPFLATFGRGMGFGDVELAALMGLAVGFSQIFVAVLGGIILGGIVAVLLLVFKIKKRKEAIPFGPFLSLATIVAMLWGTPIIKWYMGLFS
jgi:leader peptidase (prepilin peptidase) / N-methyltransferase